jgi:biopolymer transport protein ExbD
MYIADNTKKKSLISLTSLIDVVFILLVFFMLSSTFIRWNYIELGTADTGDSTIKPTEQSVIHVNLNQQYQLNKQSMLLSAIIVKLKSKLQTNGNYPILIQPADDLPLQDLVIILDAVGAIAIDNISLIKEEN